MRSAAAALLVLCALPACVGVDQGVRAQSDSGHYVQSIKLNLTRGEVGRPFFAQVLFDSNYLTAEEAEYQLSGLPPGLAFDPASRSVRGKPTRPGFYRVSVAVRKPPASERMHHAAADERWWPAEVEIEVYAPIGR